MIEIRNSETLQRWLLESGHLGRLWDRPRFLFNRDEFERELVGVREQYPRFTAGEAEARAALRLLGKEEGRSRALVIGSRRRWTRRERLFLIAVSVLAAALALLMFAPRAHAQDLPLAASYRSRLVPGHWPTYEDAQGGQPTGVMWYWQNGGSPLHTFAGGVGYVNCSTNLSCSYSSNPPTITITASGGSGSGCIPPGTTANALLFDAGGGACNDVAKFTWNSGTSTLSLASGGIFDPTSGTVKVPGTNGQLLYNNSGALGAEDPIVSGPDATGVAPTKNPVQTGALDNSTSCSSGPCVRSFVVASSAPAGTEYGLITRNIPSGTQPVSGTFWQATQPVSIASIPSTPVTGTFWQTTQPVSGTFWQTTQPVSWSGQSVSLTGSWPYSGALGTVSLTGTLPAFASTPAFNLGQYGGSNVGQSNPIYVLPTDGTHNMPMGDAAARTIHVTADNASIAVTGTFWQTTQPVSGTFWQATQPVSGTFWQSTQPVSCANAATCPVSATGTLSDNGAGATTNRAGVLPGIYRTDYHGGSGATAGRDAAPDVGTDGLLHVAALPAIRPASYTASAKFAASSTTDNAVLPGNASNTVLVTEVRVSCTQTTAGIINVEIAKRSAADTSGTSASMTAVPDDSNYSAASSAPLSYTGTGPSVGAAVGDVDNDYLGCLAPGTATPNDIYVLNLRQKPIVLRGTAQQLAVNLGGALTGGNLTVTFKWMEVTTITP